MILSVSGSKDCTAKVTARNKSASSNSLARGTILSEEILAQAGLILPGKPFSSFSDFNFFRKTHIF